LTERLEEGRNRQIEVSEPDAPTGGTAPADIHWVYLGTAYFFLSGALFYLYLARVLPPSELGAVVILQAIATIVAAAVSLGLGSGFQHFLSFYRGRREPLLLRFLLRGSLISSVVVAVIGFSIVFASSGILGAVLFRSTAYGSAIELVSLYAGLSTALAILQGVVLGLQQFVLYAVRSIVTYTATYGGAVLFLNLWPGIRSIVGGWCLGAAVGCALYGVAVLRGGIGALPAQPRSSPASLPALPLYRSVLFYSLPVFASTVITTSATYVDRLVLASVSDLASVGFYNYTLLFVGGSLIITGPFSTVLLPRISELFGRNDRNGIRAVSRTSITLVVLLYVPFALAIAALGPFLLGVLVGGAFVQDSLPLAVLLTITAVAIPYTILGSLAAGIRRTPVLLRAAAGALAANAFLSILLVPRIGILGAAIGNSAMYWTPLAVLALELRGTGLFQIDLRSMARIWAASIAMSLTIGLPLLLFGYRPLLVGASVVVGLLVLLGALRLARAIPPDAADPLVDVVPRRLNFLIPAVCWVARCDGCRHALTGPPAMPE
jgi:stage V sporulation protein B